MEPNIPAQREATTMGFSVTLTGSGGSFWGWLIVGFARTVLTFLRLAAWMFGSGNIVRLDSPVTGQNSDRIWWETRWTIRSIMFVSYLRPTKGRSLSVVGSATSRKL